MSLHWQEYNNWSSHKFMKDGWPTNIEGAPFGDWCEGAGSAAVFSRRNLIPLQPLTVETARGCWELRGQPTLGLE
jgi:hypothetical protein